MAEVSIDESQIEDLTDKVAIVTGGASGIGKAIVERLHGSGAHVVFCDLNVSFGEEIAGRLGSNVSFLKADVLIWKDLLAVFRHAKENYGHIDIVFANAGINEPSNTFEDTLDEHGDLAEPNLVTIDVNLKSVIATTKLALFYFKSNPQTGGSIVLTCSTSGYNERPNLPIYSAAKHGVAGLLRALRKGAPAAGVSISAIAPGVTATPLVPQFAQDAALAIGVPVQPAEYVALAAVVLASDKKWNGKSLTLISSRATEVEESLTETQPLWYGKYNTEMAVKAAVVNLRR